MTDDETRARELIADAYGIGVEDVGPVLNGLIADEQITADDIVGLVVDGVKA